MSDAVARLKAALEGRYVFKCTWLVGIGVAALLAGFQFWPSTAAAQTPPQEAADPLNQPVWIEGGTFSMGSTDGRDNERPVHQVTVSGFWIQEHEVTNEEYQRFVPEHQYPSGEGRYPVVSVSWQEAMDYARSRGGSLPTEAQWEFVARGTAGRTHPWGEEAPTCGRAQYFGCALSRLPVMSRPDGATPEGVHDLLGNVWEWVADWYDEYSPADVTDPSGPASGEGRVFRGGSFFVAPHFLRAAFRYNNRPGNRYDVLGFRVVWSAA